MGIKLTDRGKGKDSLLFQSLRDIRFDQEYGSRSQVQKKKKKQDGVKHRTATQDRRDFWSLQFKNNTFKMEKEKLETGNSLFFFHLTCETESKQSSLNIKIHYTCQKKCHCCLHMNATVVCVKKDAVSGAWRWREK